MNTTELTFHVSPRNQGQIVEVAYAADGEYGIAIQRVTDRSDSSVEYFAAPIQDDDECDYWQSEPSNTDWRSLTVAELRRYGFMAEDEVTPEEFCQELADTGAFGNASPEEIREALSRATKPAK